MPSPKRAKTAAEKPAEAPETFEGESLLVLLFRQWAEHLGVRSDIREIADEAVEDGWGVSERHDFPRPHNAEISDEDIEKKLEAVSTHNPGKRNYYGKHYDRMRRPYKMAAEDLKELSEVCENWANNIARLSLDGLRGINVRTSEILKQLNLILYETPEEEAGLLTAYTKVYGLFKRIEESLVQDPKPKTVQKTRKAVKKSLESQPSEEVGKAARRASQEFEEFIDEADSIFVSVEEEESLQGLEKSKKMKLLGRLIDGPDRYRICGKDEMEWMRMFALRLAERLKQESGPFCEVLKPYLQGFIESLK